MRADFLGNALDYRPFADVLQNADLKLGPMNREELTKVIEKPVQNLGVTFEDGLVERILNDVEDQPGNLPLLEFALTQLWQKQRKGLLTHKGYKDIGRIEWALAEYANDEYAKLNPADRERAKRIFMQLVRLGEETGDTRRLATRQEIGEDNWDLVTHLANTRLVVTGRHEEMKIETVEIVHEALIRHWGMFQQWVEENREKLIQKRKIEAAAEEWCNQGKAKDFLLQGERLRKAREFQKKQTEQFSLSNFAEEFINACVKRQRISRLRYISILLVIPLIGTVIVGKFYRANLYRANLYRANLKNISWNEQTNWKNVTGWKTARNIPEALKQQLGL